jgi:hypothetical protein
MMFIRREESGQVFLELIVGSLMSCVVIGLIGHLLLMCWNRCKCSRLAFESAHHSLIGRGAPFPGVRIEHRGEVIRAIAQCGREKEEVELPFLEYARW